MGKFRVSVVLAWVFCIIVSAASLINAGQTLVQGLPTSQPFKLASDIVLALLPLFFALPAALIISRQPGNSIGWLLMVLPVVTVPDNLMLGYLSAYKDTPPPVTFLNLFMIHFTDDDWVALIMPLLMIPLFFPTGRLLSPRWRWVVALAIGMCLFLFFWSTFLQTIHPSFANWKIGNPIGFISDQLDQAFQLLWLVLLGVLTLASLASIVIRYRRAVTVEREQTKWLFYTCAIFVLIYLPGLIFFRQIPQTIDDALVLLLSLAIIGFPAAISIAILRFHLFDIDVIIRLTLVYLVLSGLLGLVYLGGVIILQQAFRSITGQSTDPAVVISTLAIAVLFTPLRRRIQTIIDRSFFRQKYNAEKTLAQFALAAQGSADLDALTAMLVEITQKTLQPTQVDLYVRKQMQKAGAVVADKMVLETTRQDLILRQGVEDNGRQIEGERGG